MGLEPKIVKFRDRELPRRPETPELPFLATRLVYEVAEIARDRMEIEWKFKGARYDQIGSFS